MDAKLTRKSSITTLALAGTLAAVGVGYAAIPGSDGVIKGCYATTNGLLLGIPHSKGDTRIVDSAEACRSYETPLSWSQQGPRATRDRKARRERRATPERPDRKATPAQPEQRDPKARRATPGQPEPPGLATSISRGAPPP